MIVVTEFSSDNTRSLPCLMFYMFHLCFFFPIHRPFFPHLLLFLPSPSSFFASFLSHLLPLLPLFACLSSWDHFKTLVFVGYEDYSTLLDAPLCLSNRPFPSSLVSLFQNESKCKTFHMKMTSACSFISMQIKVIFMRMVSHLDSLWNRGTRELGNDQFTSPFHRSLLVWTIQRWTFHGLLHALIQAPNKK